MGPIFRPCHDSHVCFISWLKWRLCPIALSVSEAKVTQIQMQGGTGTDAWRLGPVACEERHADAEVVAWIVPGGTSGGLLENLTISIWKHLGPFGTTWDHLGPPGTTCGSLWDGALWVPAGTRAREAEWAQMVQMGPMVERIEMGHFWTHTNELPLERSKWSPWSCKAQDFSGR